MRSFCTAKAPHNFSAKDGSVLTNNMFENLTNNVISFEQQGPGLERPCYLLCGLGKFHR